MSDDRHKGFKLRGAPPPRHSGNDPLVVADRRDPGDEFLQREIDDNRKFEFLLIPKALVGLLVVAILVAVRVIWFQ
jgi:hypothetical protein